MKPLALFTLALAAFAQSPEWDTSGNALLTGTYNFREALWVADLQASNTLNEAACQYGTITFDGQGNYNATVTEWSSTTNSQRAYARAGTYAISASGYGFIRRPSTDGDYVYGAVANGVFIGSGTESGFNNLFVAARQSPTQVTTATFNQRYTLAYMNLPATSLTQIRDATFQIAPNGSGGLASIAVTGYSGASYTAQSQTINNASYSFSNGIGTVNFGPRNATDLVSGSQQLFVSPDGSLIFGGAANGWDMFVGLRTPAAAATAFEGLYYQAGMEVRRNTLPSGTAVLDSYYGSLNVIPPVKSVIGHQRLQVAPDSPFEYTYSDVYNLSATGAHDDALGLQYFVSADGNVRIGYGKLDYLGINVSIKAPAFSGSGMYLNPTGVVNAASFAPFTAGIAPGELITLFGTGLAANTAIDANFPTTLAGVTVTINGKLAPIYVVSPTQLSLLVPYEIEPGVAEIRVSRGGTNSNRVTVYVNRTAPGVFAVPPTGLGYAAALHPDYSLVTAQNPVRPGETIAVYLTGLGVTNPAVANGALGPVDPLAKTTEVLDASLAGRNAKIVFSGLAPQLRGLYQLNFEVPANAASGDQYFEVGGPDTFNSQILLPVAGPRAAQNSVRTRNGPSSTRSSSASRDR